MATIKYEIEFEESVFASLVTAFVYQYGYKSKITDENGEEIDNPDTPVDFMRVQTAKYWEDVLNGYNKSKAIREVEESFQATEVSLNAKSM